MGRLYLQMTMKIHPDFSERTCRKGPSSQRDLVWGRVPHFQLELLETNLHWLWQYETGSPLWAVETGTDHPPCLKKI